MKTVCITFSPTGGTMKAAEMLCGALSLETKYIDITDPIYDKEFILIENEDLVVIAVPSFAGRVPALCAKRMENISGNNAKCILLCVYGNRAYDDTLIEMKDIAHKVGLIPIAAISAIAEHSSLRSIASGRPDIEDGNKLSHYAMSILNKLVKHEAEELTVPGNRPYRQGMPVSAAPLVNEDCDHCGLCAEKCPAQALVVSEEAVSEISGKCIGCNRCVYICPKQARYYPAEKIKSTEGRLAPYKNIRKEPELFI